jgi:hypothetical protein
MAKGETDKPSPATSATTATRGANEWGIPDWRDAAAYGDVKRWNFNRWRWEFYRRREDLRYVFDLHAQDSFARWHRYSQSEPNIFNAWWCDYARELGVTSPPEPTEAGFVAFIPERVADFFGYFRLPNPRISNQPDFCIIPTEDDGTITAVKGADTDTLHATIGKFGISLTGRNSALLDDMMKQKPTPIGNNEVAVVFNLGKPLAPQIDVAQKNLARLQADIHGKQLQKRRHPSKWLEYLRTLDAREDGASWAEIAALHPRTAQTEQTARDIWKAANALRFNF